MQAARSLPETTKRVVAGRLWWAGPLVIAAAIVANTLIRLAAVAVLQPDPAFMPLTPMNPIGLTFVGVLAAVIVFAVVARFARRPVTTFKRIALVALIVSLVPDVLMLATGFLPGTTLANVLALMLMHVVAWAISVYGLTALTRAD
jgi:hypothetical protein